VECVAANVRRVDAPRLRGSPFPPPRVSMARDAARSLPPAAPATQTASVRCSLTTSRSVLAAGCIPPSTSDALKVVERLPPTQCSTWTVRNSDVTSPCLTSSVTDHGPTDSRVRERSRVSLPSPPRTVLSSTHSSSPRVISLAAKSGARSAVSSRHKCMTHPAGMLSIRERDVNAACPLCESSPTSQAVRVPSIVTTSCRIIYSHEVRLHQL
jgi:hypothetical protein